MYEQLSVSSRQAAKIFLLSDQHRSGGKFNKTHSDRLGSFPPEKQKSEMRTDIVMQGRIQRIQDRDIFNRVPLRSANNESVPVNFLSEIIYEHLPFQGFYQPLMAAQNDVCLLSNLSICSLDFHLDYSILLFQALKILTVRMSNTVNVYKSHPNTMFCPRKPRKAILLNLAPMQPQIFRPCYSFRNIGTCIKFVASSYSC